MNNTCNTKRTRRRPNHFAPSLSHLINEIFHTPIKDVVKDQPKRYSYPRANVVKTDTGIELSLALPGIQKEDVSISIDKNKLHIKAEIEENTDTKYRLREFNYAKFDRAFNLSDNADIDNISANFKNGILNISIPTVAEAAPMQVTIG